MHDEANAIFIATFSPLVVLRLLEAVAEHQAAQAHNLAECERMRTQRTTLERQVARQREALIAASGCIKLLDRNPTHGDGVDSILEQIVAALTQETT